MSQSDRDLLKNIRKRMGMDIKSMAILMGMPYRTYQSYELGERGISAAVLTKARQVEDHDRETTTQVVNRAVDRILAKFPGGIPSEKILDFP